MESAAQGKLIRVKLKSKNLNINEKIKLLQKYFSSVVKPSVGIWQPLVQWIFIELSRQYRERCDDLAPIIGQLWLLAKEALDRILSYNLDAYLTLPRCMRTVLLDALLPEFEVPVACYEAFENIFCSDVLAKFFTKDFASFLECLSRVLTSTSQILSLNDSNEYSLFWFSGLLGFIHSLINRLQHVLATRTNRRQLVMLVSKNLLRVLILLHHNINHDWLDHFPDKSEEILRKGVKVKSSLVQVVVTVFCNEELVHEFFSSNFTILPEAFLFLLQEVKQLSNDSSDCRFSINQFLLGIFSAMLQFKAMDDQAILLLFKNFVYYDEMQTASDHFISLLNSFLVLLANHKICNTGRDNALEETVAELSIHLASDLLRINKRSLFIVKGQALKSLVSLSHTFIEPFMTELLKISLFVDELNSDLDDKATEVRSDLLSTLLQTFSDLKQLDRFFVLLVDGVFYLRKSLQQGCSLLLPTRMTPIFTQVITRAAVTQVIQVTQVLMDAICNSYILRLSSPVKERELQQDASALDLLISILSLIALHGKNFSPNDYTEQLHPAVLSFVDRVKGLSRKMWDLMTKQRSLYQKHFVVSTLRVEKLYLDLALTMQSATLATNVDGDNKQFEQSLNQVLVLREKVKSIPEAQILMSDIFVSHVKVSLVMRYSAAVPASAITSQLLSLKPLQYKATNLSGHPIVQADDGTALLNVLLRNFSVVGPLLTLDGLEALSRHIVTVLMQCSHVAGSIEIAKTFLRLPAFYEVASMQLLLCTNLVTALIPHLSVLGSNFTHVLCAIREIDHTRKLDTDDDATEHSTEESERTKSGDYSWEFIQRSIFDLQLHMFPSSEMSKDVYTTFKSSLDICLLLHVSKMVDVALAKFCCFGLFVMSFLGMCTPEQQRTALLEQASTFLCKVCDIAVQRNQALCWSILSAKLILHWTTSLITERLCQLDDFVTCISVVLFKSRGPHSALSVKEICRNLLDFSNIDDQFDERRLRGINCILVSAVTVLGKKPVSDYSRNTTSEVANVCSSALTQYILARQDVQATKPSRYAASCLAKAIEIFALSGRMDEIYDGSCFIEPRFQESVTKCLEWVRRSTNVSRTFSYCSTPFETEFLRVICSYTPFLECPLLQKAEFWNGICASLLNGLLCTNCPENDIRLRVERETVFELMHSILHNTHEASKELCLQGLSNLFCQGFPEERLSLLSLELWIYLLKADWRKERRLVLKPVASQILLSCIRYLNAELCNPTSGNLESLLCLITHLVGFGHGLLPSSVIMASMNMNLSKFPVLSVSSVSNIIKYYYHYLSMLLFKHNNVVEQCLHSFLAHVHQLLMFVVRLVYRLSETQDKTILSTDDFHASFMFMGRLYQELGTRSQNIAKYAPYIVSDYFRTTKNISMPSVCESYLNSGIFSIFDACGDHQFALLQTVLGEDERDLFKALYNDYVKFYKFKGKA